MGWIEKAEAHQREHSRRRMAERFRFKLTRNLRGTILADIRAGRAEHLGDSRHFPGRSLWRVVVRSRGYEHPVRVVYDRLTDQIVTVMRADRLV